MRRTAIALAAGVMLAASPTPAQQLLINFDDCAAAGNSKDRTLNCASTTDRTVIVCSAMTPTPITGVMADLGIMDFVVGSDPGVLPDFWQFQNGGCNGTTNRLFDADFTAGPFTCFDIWRGLAGGGGIYRSSDSPATNRPRVKHAWAVPDYFTIPGGVEFYVSRLKLLQTKALACPGCPTPVCVVYLQETFSRFDGSVVTIDSPDEIHMNGGTGCLGPTPVRRTTWGRVKALFR